MTFQPTDRWHSPNMTVSVNGNGEATVAEITPIDKLGQNLEAIYELQQVQLEATKRIIESTVYTAVGLAALSVLVYATMRHVKSL